MPKTSWLLGPLVAVMLVPTLALGPAEAQSSDPGRRPVAIWGELALGAAGIADSGFYAASLGAGVQLRRLLVVARVGSLSTPDRQRIKTVDLLAGLGTRPATFQADIAAGLGVVRDSRDSSGVAFPVEAEVTWRVTSWGGVGLRLFGNLNRLADFGGVTLTVRVGRLRP